MCGIQWYHRKLRPRTKSEGGDEGKQKRRKGEKKRKRENGEIDKKAAGINAIWLCVQPDFLSPAPTTPGYTYPFAHARGLSHGSRFQPSRNHVFLDGSGPSSKPPMPMRVRSSRAWRCGAGGGAGGCAGGGKEETGGLLIGGSGGSWGYSAAWCGRAPAGCSISPLAGS